MKRDMDLVRGILLAIEANESGRAPQKLSVDGYTDEQIGYHVLIMMEAGVVVGRESKEIGRPPNARATRLTWEGHDFLDASREPARWEKAKGVASKVGGVTIEVMGTILTRLMLAQADTAIGQLGL